MLFPPPMIGAPCTPGASWRLPTLNAWAWARAVQVQRLLARLIKCVPEGAAMNSEVSIQAASLVSRAVSVGLPEGVPHWQGRSGLQCSVASWKGAARCPGEGQGLQVFACALEHGAAEKGCSGFALWQGSTSLGGMAGRPPEAALLPLEVKVWDEARSACWVKANSSSWSLPGP